MSGDEKLNLTCGTVFVIVFLVGLMITLAAIVPGVLK